MKKIKLISKALAALMLIIAVSATNADAQIGKNLLNKAKQAGKEIIQGGDSQQNNSQQSQQPAQQQQNSAPQQNNNQTAKPSQQTTQPAPKQNNAPAEKTKQYTKADYTAEAQQLVGKVDSTSKLYDVIRVYMYLYRQTENALDTKDYDFMVDSFTYYSDVWRIVNNIGINDIGNSEFDKRYYAEEKPKEMQQFVSTDFYMIKSKHKEDGHVAKLQERITNSMQSAPYGQLPDQDLPAWLNNMLTKAETCKGPNAKARFLQYILTAREENTIKKSRIYPTDENIYTERIKALMETVPNDILEKWHCPAFHNAEETRNLRLEYIKENLLKSPIIPKVRDAALEAKFKKEILAQRPDVKIKAVIFQSDGTADWHVKKTELGVPTRRMKEGWVVVECPGLTGIGAAFPLQSEQKYLGGGKYGAGSSSCSIPKIDDKIIYTNDDHGVTTLGWTFCKL